MKKVWKIVKIPEVLYFQEGPGVRKHQFTTEGVKLLNVGNINDGQINLSKTKIYISDKEAFGKYKHFLVDEGDLVIASSGIVVNNFRNKIAFIKKEHLPLCMNTSTIRFKVIDEEIININYFKYFLKTNFFSKQLQKLITGSAQLNFGPSHLKKIDLLIPPIEDQKRIVKLLDKAEALCQKRKQAVEYLDDYLKSVFLEMFGDPVKNPKKWEMVQIIKISKKITDGEHLNPEFTNDGMPMVMAGNVLENKVDLNTAKKVNFEKGLLFRGKCNPEKFDILLVSRGATIGRLCKVDIPVPFCLMGSVILIKPNINVLNSSFLTSLLKHPVMYQKLFNSSGSSAQQAIYLKDVKKLVCILPPLNLQNQFAAIVEKVESLKQKMLTQSEELENQFQALMQKAFKGAL